MPEEKELLEKQQDILKSLEETGYRFDEHPQFKGVIKDMQHERQTRQTAEDRVAQLQEENRVLTEELANQDTKPEKEEENENPDALLTRAEAKKLLDKALSQGQKASEQEKKQAHDKRLFASEEEARKMFSAEKVGEGMDYDTVIKDGYVKMLKKNPAYHQVVVASDNPAAEAYRIGLLEESFAKKLDENKTKEVLSKIKTGGAAGIPKTSIAAFSEKSDYEDMLKKSPAELERELREEETPH